MAGMERAKAAWAAAFAVWESGYVKEAAPLAALLADQAPVPLDPFLDDGHSPYWRPCSTAPLGKDVCDMEAVFTRSAASAAIAT